MFNSQTIFKRALTLRVVGVRLNFNFKRWVVVGFLATLIIFSFVHLSSAGSNYKILTTSDSGFFYDIARDTNEMDGLPDVQEHSHPPEGNPVSGKGQFQPLMLVTIYRGLHSVDPSITLMDTSRYFGPLVIVLSLVGVFLAGRELGGNIAGGASAFFLSTLIRPIYWTKAGAFDREITLIFFGVWIFYLLVKLFKAPRQDVLKYSIISGLVTGIFFITWPGAMFIAVTPITALILVLLFKLPSHYTSARNIENAIIKDVRDNLHLIGGVIVMFVIITLMAIILGDYRPDFWVGFAHRIGGFIGLGGGGGLASPRVATEMRVPTDYLSSFNATGTFQNIFLTKVTIALAAFGILKIFWTRKNHEFLLIPWIIVPAAMATTQVRFFRLFWPVWPIVAAYGLWSLIWMVRQLMKSPALMSSKWLDRLRQPTIAALIVVVFITPFVCNARANATDRIPRPHGGTDPSTYHSLVKAYNWLRENTPEDSVIAVEWSYGSLLTGLANRGSVTDGATTGGIWENRELPPPDYARLDVNGDGKITAVDDTDGDGKWEIEASRRGDMQHLYYEDEEDFEQTIQTYRDDYNLKIDYWVSNFGHSYKNQMSTNALTIYYRRYTSNFQDYKSLHSTPEGLPVLEFENENIVFDGSNAYVQHDNDKRYLAGVINTYFRKRVHDQLDQILQRYPSWAFQRFFSWRRYYYGTGIVPQHNFRQDPDIQKILWFHQYIDERGMLRFLHAQLSDFDGVPMVVRAQDNFKIPDYIREVYSAPHKQAKVYEIHHVPSLISPENNVELTNNTPTLEWSSSVGGVKYQLAVDNDLDFSSPEILENITATTYSPGTPLADDDYYWRVCAFNKDNESVGWSDVQSFTIQV